MEKVFFTVRMQYATDLQWHSNEGAQHLWQEHARDRALLEEFAHFLESEGGRLDLATVAGFGCLYPDSNNFDDVSFIFTCLFHA